ncbi:hypothetical protein [Haladaptatus sp. CMAA 1911]|uniref:hypothetical protein n=1 Tax=unclassified Haladaptatus TaxID=2622732 RepID=UPI00375422E8
MSRFDTPQDARRWLKENQDTLVSILRHCDDEFARACALTALMHCGSDPDIEQVKHELELAQEVMG